MQCTQGLGDLALKLLEKRARGGLELAAQRGLGSDGALQAARSCVERVHGLSAGGEARMQLTGRVAFAALQTIADRVQSALSEMQTRIT